MSKRWRCFPRATGAVCFTRPRPIESSSNDRIALRLIANLLTTASQQCRGGHDVELVVKNWRYKCRSLDATTVSRPLCSVSLLSSMMTATMAHNNNAASSATSATTATQEEFGINGDHAWRTIPIANQCQCQLASVKLEPLPLADQRSL